MSKYPGIKVWILFESSKNPFLLDVLSVTKVMVILSGWFYNLWKSLDHSRKSSNDESKDDLRLYHHRHENWIEDHLAGIKSTIQA